MEVQGTENDSRVLGDAHEAQTISAAAPRERCIGCRNADIGWEGGVEAEGLVDGVLEVRKFFKILKRRRLY